jgi:predicted nucleotidyltransferase
MQAHGLTEKDHLIIRTLFGRFPQIKEAVLFGSRADGTFKKGSDIDFAIKGEGISDIIGGIRADFEESDLIYEVDIIDYDKIKSPELLAQIAGNGIVFYQRTQITE